jgi:hypothetical protein
VAEPIKVFLSSRFDEFKELRRLVGSLLEQDSDICLVNLDDNRAHSLDAVSRSLQELQESDLVVFVLGATYSGADMTAGAVSVTEQEFDHAVNTISKGLALDFRVWSLRKSDSWDYRSVTFLEKAQKHKVVGTLPDGEVFDQAAELVDDIRMLADEIRSNMELGLGSTFVETARVTLRNMSLSLAVDHTATKSEGNEHRRQFLHQRDHVLETMSSTPDLSWTERELEEVRSKVPNDLLTRLLLVLICQHRDRPADRKRAVTLLQDFAGLVEHPTRSRTLSIDETSRRKVELVALRAKVERLAIGQGHMPHIADRIAQLNEVYQSEPGAPFNRAILTERVLWAKVLFDSQPGSQERSFLAESLMDMVRVFPDFAASLAASSKISGDVLSEVEKYLCDRMPNNFERRSKEQLSGLLKRIRKYVEERSEELSPLVVEVLTLRREVGHLHAERKAELYLPPSIDAVGPEVSEMIRRHAADQAVLLESTKTVMYDSLPFSRCVWDQKSFSLVEESITAVYQRTERPSSYSGHELGNPAVNTEGDLASIRSEVSALDEQSGLHSRTQNDATSSMTRLARRNSIKWKLLLVNLLIGLGVSLVVAATWWLAKGYGFSKESLDEFAASGVGQWFYDSSLKVVIVIIVVYIAVIILGLSAYGAKAGGFGGGVAGFIGGVVIVAVLVGALPVLFLSVIIATAAVFALGVATGIGGAIYFPAISLVRWRRGHDIRYSIKMNTQISAIRKALVSFHDVKYLHDVFLPEARVLAEKMFEERDRVEAQYRIRLEDVSRRLDPALGDLKRVVSLYNQRFKSSPAVYNREYVPQERAGDYELTRISLDGSGAREKLVMGRKVPWTGPVSTVPNFLPLPITVEACKKIESLGLQAEVEALVPLVVS